MKNTRRFIGLLALIALISMYCVAATGDVVATNVDYPPGVYVNVFSNIEVNVINCGGGDCNGNNGDGNGNEASGNGGGVAPGDLVFIGKKTGLMVKNSQVPTGPMPGLASAYQAGDCLKVGIFNIGDNPISIGKWELKVVEDANCDTGNIQSRNTLSAGTTTTHTVPKTILPAISGERGGDGKPGFIEFSVPMKNSGSATIILYDEDGIVVDQLRYTNTTVMLRDNNGAWAAYGEDIIPMISANQRWTTASWAA